MLQTFPGFSDEVSGLLNQIKPTLPVLLANLGTVSEILMTYNASLEQLLVLLPPYFAQQQSYSPLSDSTGSARGDFAVTVSDPPACTVGFLPPSAWRSPDDQSDIDTPDGLYCKLPQDSPIAVRGVRNFPCIRKPGKRAPTVQICNSDKPFEPLAMRQHATGPAPIDPSLIAQGIPIDDRADARATTSTRRWRERRCRRGRFPRVRLPVLAARRRHRSRRWRRRSRAASATATARGQFAERPADSGRSARRRVPRRLPPGDVPPPDAPPAPVGRCRQAAGDGAVPGAPSAFGTTKPGRAHSGVAQYNPRTGEYVGSDGKLYKVTNLVADAPLPKTWKDLLPH